MASAAEPDPPPVEHVLSSSHVAALLEAVIALGRELHLESVLRRVVTCAAELAGARYGALGVLDRERPGLVDFLHVGLDPDDAAAIGALPEGRGLLGLLIQDPRPQRVDDLASHPASSGFPPHHPPMTTFLGVPIRVRGEVFGNLYLTEKVGGDAFTDEDEQLVVALASVAGVAIENWRLHERVSELAATEERERIALALHDTVIQRLFSIGLALDGVASKVDDLEVVDRLRQAAADLDETVDQVRASVLEPERAEEPRRPVRRELTDFLEEVAERAGVEVAITFDGDIDGVLGPDALRPVADQLFASARDALVALAAQPVVEKVELKVEVADQLRLRVGTPAAAASDETAWLAALDERAHLVGGRAALAGAGPERAVLWVVPLV